MGDRVDLGAVGGGGSSEFRVPSSEFRVRVRVRGRVRVPSSDLRVPSSEFRVPSSEFRCPSSDVRCPSSDVRSPSTEFRCPSSDVRCPSSDVRCPMSDVRSPISDLRSPSTEFRSPSSGCWWREWEWEWRLVLVFPGCPRARRRKPCSAYGFAPPSAADGVDSACARGRGPSARTRCPWRTTEESNEGLRSQRLDGSGDP